MLIIIVTKYY